MYRRFPEISNDEQGEKENGYHPEQVETIGLVAQVFHIRLYSVLLTFTISRLEVKILFRLQ